MVVIWKTLNKYSAKKVCHMFVYSTCIIYHYLSGYILLFLFLCIFLSFTDNHKHSTISPGIPVNQIKCKKKRIKRHNKIIIIKHNKFLYKINKTYEQHLLSLHSKKKLLTIKPLKCLFNSSCIWTSKNIIYDTSSPHKLKVLE